MDLLYLPINAWPRGGHERSRERDARGGDGGRSSGSSAAADAHAVEADLEEALRCLEAALRSDPNLALEAKGWLVDTIASLTSVDPKTAAACLLPADPSARPPLGRAAERQLILSALEAAPADLGSLLSSSTTLLRTYFTRPGAAAAFFGRGFLAAAAASAAGGGAASASVFKGGAGALANFALARRDEVWCHLVWAGKHPQAPVAVAAKPHYFGELDVAATISNLARDCPTFWESRELAKSLEDGGWTALDPDYLVQELQERLDDGGSRWREVIHCELTKAVTTSLDWGPLVKRVAPLMGEAELLRLLRTLGDTHFSRRTGRDLRAWAAAAAGVGSSGNGGSSSGGGFGGPRDNATLVLAGVEWRDVRDPILAAALACRGAAALVRLLSQDKEAARRLARVERLAERLHGGAETGAGSGSSTGASARQRAFLSRLDPASPRQRLLLIVNHWTLRLSLLRRAAATALLGTFSERLMTDCGWRWERRDARAAEGSSGGGDGGGRGAGGSTEAPPSSSGRGEDGNRAEEGRAASAGPGPGSFATPVAAVAGRSEPREPLSRGATATGGSSRHRSRSRSRSRGRSSKKKRRKKDKRSKKRRRRSLSRSSSGSGDSLLPLSGGGGSSDGDSSGSEPDSGHRSRSRADGAGGRLLAAAGAAPSAALYRAWPPGSVDERRSGSSAVAVCFEGTAEEAVEALVGWASRRWVHAMLSPGN